MLFYPQVPQIHHRRNKTGFFNTSFVIYNQENLQWLLIRMMYAIPCKNTEKTFFATQLVEPVGGAGGGAKALSD
ncbi:hypothetical protein Y032_0014g2422 [Ancylostoma ceylanicum]|uniref:Uncharacterized protein n=1 Tax=Ancylostoma ceylanicum TaxID=53326 RepID=A0A016V9D7_9BILA|nr:hypothetical protein Y032_0014g2422 [Ancylostoma ceylanicum]